ncbi:MAG: ribosome biogenesis GTP-binding protein YihA/YsxC [Lachnospiraceae bacterium]|nr:ribosome biogenesis GTP-binding protein YihA/YsxC [Lachnospiraceae bacterium]
MKIIDAELETVCGVTSKLPKNHLPEIAFCGRSNVGKSSLINSLMERKKLARTSQQPGKTQTLNFYKVNSVLYLVDLPGYGYAKNSQANREAWGVMIQNYLTGSDMLRYVFQLVDIRHDPSSDDQKMYDWLTYLGFDPIIIATKSDKLKPREIESHMDRISEVLGLGSDAIIVPFSSVTKQGLDTLNDFMDQVVENEKDLK